MPALNKLYDSYRDRAAFYIVYIQEAHPTDVWQMESNVKDGVLFASPARMENAAQPLPPAFAISEFTFPRSWMASTTKRSGPTPAGPIVCT